MTPAELYDATRASWKVGARRESAKYALAVFEGIVREVYEIIEAGAFGGFERVCTGGSEAIFLHSTVYFSN